MARIAFAAYHEPVLRQYMRLTGLIFTYNSGRHRYFEATNKLIARSPMFTGMKTGSPKLAAAWFQALATAVMK